MSRIFLLEDDCSLITGLSFSLKKQGFELEMAKTIAEANMLWQENKFDLLILDVSLPDGSGFDFCQRVRRTSDVPIIFLTASDEEINVIMGLDMGGDDYISKPFSIHEVLARVRAVLKRAPAETSGTDNSPLRMDMESKMLYVKGEPVVLSRKEFELLALLVSSPGKIFSREEIISRLWQDAPYGLDRTIDVHIARIRAKLGDNKNCILNRSGYGYCYNPSGL